MRRTTQEEVIESFKKIHGSKYDYSHVSYKTARDKIKIICPVHGEFEQVSSEHIRGRGCYECGKQIINRDRKFTQQQFIDKVLENNIPNLSFEKTIYIDKREDVIVTCSIHGDYITKAEILLKGNGCKKCASIKLSTDRTKTISFFIEQAIIVHGNIYDYSLVDYKGAFKKITILCLKHNKTFEQTPSVHLRGSGCPICKLSKGELLVCRILDDLGVKYIRQKSFVGLKIQRNLYFDFYLEDYNSCIEFDGEQHYVSIELWGGIERLNNNKMKDALKDKYCELNNISLLRIKYDDTKVKEIIEKFLLKG